MRLPFDFISLSNYICTCLRRLLLFGFANFKMEFSGCEFQLHAALPTVSSGQPDLRRLFGGFYESLSLSCGKEVWKDVKNSMEVA